MHGTHRKYNGYDVFTVSIAPMLALTKATRAENNEKIVYCHFLFAAVRIKDEGRSLRVDFFMSVCVVFFSHTELNIHARRFKNIFSFRYAFFLHWFRYKMTHIDRFFRFANIMCSTRVFLFFENVYRKVDGGR